MGLNFSYAFLLSIVAVSSCATLSTQESAIQLDVGTKAIRISENQKSPIEVDGVSIWSDSFESPRDSAEQTRRLKIRRDLFLAGFVDDKDPYTGRVTPHSKCLLSKDAASVAFLSGPDQCWSDCHLEGRSPARRLWQICGNRLWEVTVKTDKPVKLSCL